MNRNLIEARVLQFADRLKSKQPIEDDHLELKREWLLPDKAARRLAGHANASRGEPILWLIGIDEKAGTIPGADANELSNWWAGVQGRFADNVCPDLVTSVNVQVDDAVVVAMYFHTDRAPYVVKNSGGGGITAEVPWRVGNSTYSATRSQLLRVLTPVHRLPQVEVLTWWIQAEPNSQARRSADEAVNWTGYLTLYVVPVDQSLIVFPEHRLTGSMTLWESVARLRVAFMHSDSLIEVTAYEAIANGPGRLVVSMGYNSHVLDTMPDSIPVTVSMRSSNGEYPVVVSATLPRVMQADTDPNDRRLGVWEVKKL